MGTRSITRIFDNDKLLATIYRQTDSYPSGHGQEIADFIQSREFVNGISGSRAVFNGMGCFAAQLIGHLKRDEAGRIYMTPADAEDQEYVYEIRGGLDENYMPKPVTMKCMGRGGNVHFDGSASEFAAFVERDETME